MSAAHKHFVDTLRACLGLPPIYAPERDRSSFQERAAAWGHHRFRDGMKPKAIQS